MSIATAARFRKGDPVWVNQIQGRVRGTVVEDRGPLGVEGRRLYRVNVSDDPYVSEEFLVREEEIEPATQGDAGIGLSTPAIVDYLKTGGLLAILSRNSPTPIWLRRDSHDNVTFTFTAGHSEVGGKPAPQFVLEGEKIFSPKLGEVIEFLTSFGLSRSQARQVIREIGTAGA
jgi:hypothetical protein